jgi:hypothetical protein
LTARSKQISIDINNLSLVAEPVEATNELAEATHKKSPQHAAGIFRNMLVR